jgi:oligopeptide transport system ATP-binding protein
MEELLTVRDVTKSFVGRSGVGAKFRREPVNKVMALDGVSFDVGRREVLGIVGESGSGKTTLARVLVRLVEPDSGSVAFDGQDVFGAKAGQLRAIRRRMQMIYQDPYSSLNPRLRVGEAMAEPARVHGLVAGRTEEDALVAGLLDAVGLPRSTAGRRPRELSGGQRQRVAIARALAVEPELVIADEPVSALDVSVQAQILNLFLAMSQDRHFAMIFISHQLAVVAHVADRVAIMYLGRIVEIGRIADVFVTPKHPYTALLLAAHPHPDTRDRRRASAFRGDIPTQGDIAAGCRFRGRCPLAQPICAEVDPPPVDVGHGHQSWCHVMPVATDSPATPFGTRARVEAT